MKTEKYEELSPQERDELALFGIGSADALTGSSASRIIGDLKRAKACFPERDFALTEQKILRLFEKPRFTETVVKGENALPDGNSHDNLPTTGFMPPSRGSRKPDVQKKAKKRSNTCMHTPVRCTHPYLTYFAAVSVLLLIVPLAGIVAFTALILTNNLPDIPFKLTATVVFILPWVLYIFFAWNAKCPVCHMRIFRWSHYSRNRAAHYLPLLGYNVATALHLLIFWNFNCPACGTPIRYFGVRSHRKHH